MKTLVFSNFPINTLLAVYSNTETTETRSQYFSWILPFWLLLLNTRAQLGYSLDFKKVFLLLLFQFCLPCFFCAVASTSFSMQISFCFQLKTKLNGWHTLNYIHSPQLHWYTCFSSFNCYFIVYSFNQFPN